MIIEETQLESSKLHPSNNESFDLIIIGAGPAGMSAALCAGRAKLKTLILEKTLPGGQTTTAYKITNLLGYPSGVLGETLAFDMENHVNNHDIYFSREVCDNIHIHANQKWVYTNMGNIYKCSAIIIATGLEPKKIGTDFEQKFMGRGVSYYAQSDPEQYRNKDVAVIGGGNCACYAADYLADVASHLYLIHRSDSLKAVKSLKENVLNNSKIVTFWNSEVAEVFGIDKVEKIKIRNVLTDQYTWVDVKGVFIYVGRIPPKDFSIPELHLDEKGYIVTDEYMRTNIKGIYAAGDIRSKQIRQISTAVADGMIAAINVERDLER